MVARGRRQRCGMGVGWGILTSEYRATVRWKYQVLVWDYKTGCPEIITTHSIIHRAGEEDWKI